MHWIVGLRVDIPEYTGSGDFKVRIRNNWKQRKVIVQLAKDLVRDGWIVDGKFVAPIHSDTQSAAPVGRAEGELIQMAACRGVIEANPPNELGHQTYATAHTLESLAGDPPGAELANEARKFVTDKQAQPDIDLTKPLTLAVLNGLKFFTFQAHVQRLTGMKPATKEKGIELLRMGNLIVEPVAA